MILYVLIDHTGREVYETSDYVDAVHYTIVHSDCTIRKFYTLGGF